MDELVNRLNVSQGAKLKAGMTWDNQALDRVIHRIVSGARQPLAETAWLRSMFNEDYFKKKLDSSFLPAWAVQPGDTWNISGEWLMQKGGLLMGDLRLMRDCTITFQCWEMRGQRICARLEFRGTEKTRAQLQSETARAIIPIMAGTYSGVCWFDPELGRSIEVVSTRDFTGTSNKRVAGSYANPTVLAPLQATTDHHHQVITESMRSG